MYLSSIATIVALPGHSEAVLEALKAMLGPTRAEPGCLQYDLHVCPNDPNRLVMIERWVDQAALDTHFATPYMARLKREIEGKTMGIDLVLLDFVA